MEGRQPPATNGHQPQQQPSPVTTPLATFNAAPRQIQPVTQQSPTTPASVADTPTTPNASNGYFEHPMASLLPSEYPIAADSFQYSYETSNPTPSRPMSSLTINTADIRPPSSSGHSEQAVSVSPIHSAHPLHSPALTEPFAPQYTNNMTWALPSPAPTSTTLSPPPAGSLLRTYPSLSHFSQQRHSLDNLPVPRDQIMEILKLFFLYVYPLTPCIHKPTFMADLHSRREERDPLFFALVLSTVASTLVQVPRSYLPFFDRASVRKLALYCSEASRLITVAGYDPPTSMQVVIRYL